MSYTVAEMFNLFQFAKGYSGLAICRLTKINSRTMDIARSENTLTKLVNGRMVNHFGPDWNSAENLRDYQRKKNIADSIDHERLARLRQEQKYSLKTLGSIIGVGAKRLARIESGTGSFNNWQEYTACVKVLKDDLLPTSKSKAKTETVRKEFITFKNVGGHWEMGKRIVQA